MSPLWTQARDFIRTLFRCCGEPQEIAKQGFIARKLYAHFLAWIRAGETLLRRMLLIEANALSVPPPSRRQPAGKMPAVRQRKLIEFLPEQPDDWRVSFRCPLDRRRLAGEVVDAAPPSQTETQRRRGAGAPSFFSPWPLALRAEALLRICNNPAPYIARLARFITRAPKAIARIMKPPHQRTRQSGDPAPMRDIVGHDLWDGADLALSNTS